MPNQDFDEEMKTKQPLAAHWLIWLCLAVMCVGFAASSKVAYGFTANKVWFEFRKNGMYRVYANYTVPELKEFRESYVEFRSKKKAEKYYFDLIRGSNFYQPKAKDRKFTNQPLIPVSW